ncbi:unnamed protein product [Periconia digitata]|uniref:Uncharacterized protein n=1 Tax=Periconia digitata TaxID=1303443 RepID=A0A9W4UIG6_9PLEO|nr:unnamed protein product [Periconia digitata]
MLCHAFFRNPSFLWSSASFFSASAFFVLSGSIILFAVLSFISSASISKIVRWFWLRYLGMLTLNSTRRSPFTGRRLPSFFMPMPDKVTRSPELEPVGTLTRVSPSRVGILISPPNTAVVIGMVAVWRMSEPVRLKLGLDATRMTSMKETLVCISMFSPTMICSSNGFLLLPPPLLPPPPPNALKRSSMLISCPKPPWKPPCPPPNPPKPPKPPPNGLPPP